MDFTLGCDVGTLRRADDQSAVQIRFDTWMRYSHIAAVALPERATIHRSELRDLARATWASGTCATPEAIERLFVATMMWGSGTANGRGPRYTDEALSTRSVPGVLTDARAL